MSNCGWIRVDGSICRYPPVAIKNLDGAGQIELSRRMPGGVAMSETPLTQRGIKFELADATG